MRNIKKEKEKKKSGRQQIQQPCRYSVFQRELVLHLTLPCKTPWRCPTHFELPFN